MKTVLALTIITAALTPGAVGAHIDDPDSGRRVHVGAYAGLARCEAPVGADGIDANERNHRTGVASSAWQFMPATWRWVAHQRGKPWLARKHPTQVTLAQQLRQTIWLHQNVGIQQWSCWRAYGRGDGWVTVYDEAAMPKNPKRCFLNLRDDWGLPARTARTVCGHD